MHFAAYLFIIIIIIIVIIINISILDFKFPTRGVTDYVINRNMRRLTAVTVCLWMRSSNQTNQGTPFSYAVSSHDNELLFEYYKYIDMMVKGGPAK